MQLEWGIGGHDILFPLLQRYNTVLQDNNYGPAGFWLFPVKLCGVIEN